MHKPTKIKAIIVAAGRGKRMGADYNKQYILLRNKPVLAYTLEVFQKSLAIEEIILVVGKGEVDYCKENVVNPFALTKVTSIMEGGNERYNSVYKGIIAAKEDCDVVVIHDGARPFITDKNILDSIEGAKEYGATVVGVPVKDTIKVVDDDLTVVNTPVRKRLWSIQTPQTFKYQLIKSVYDNTPLDETITDDASLVEKAGYPVKVILGNYENIKLTTPDDLLVAEEILKKGDL